MFPGYLFCRFDASKPGSVLSVPGVVHIVSAGGKPIAVDDREIESVQTICRSDVPFEPFSTIAAGQRVTIVRGPLTGAEGVVVRVSDRHRLVASVSILQRAVSTELDLDWISFRTESLVENASRSAPGGSRLLSA